MYLLLKINFRFFYVRVLSFNAIPKYRDNVYDPDPEKSYTKAKLQRHSANNKENRESNSSISSTAENPEVLFPTDEEANELFNNKYWRT